MTAGVHFVPCSFVDGVSRDVDSVGVFYHWMRNMVIVYRLLLCFLSDGVGLCAGGIETHKHSYNNGVEMHAFVESVHVRLTLGQEFA